MEDKEIMKQFGSLVTDLATKDIKGIADNFSIEKRLKEEDRELKDSVVIACLEQLQKVNDSTKVYIAGYLFAKSLRIFIDQVDIETLIELNKEELKKLVWRRNKKNG